MGAGAAVNPVAAAVVVAMADEAEPFISRADQVEELGTTAGAQHRRLDFPTFSILLIQSGIGLVNAASAAATVLSAQQVPLLISAGSAGGLGLHVHVGDVVVADTTVYSAADATAFGYQLGQIPGMPQTYPGDAALVTAATACGTDQIPTHRGQVLSSDTFVDAALVERVRQQFPQALSTDMESTSLAQVTHLFGVPFVSVRGVSDLCGPTAGQDHTLRVDDAAERSAIVVLGMLSAL